MLARILVRRGSADEAERAFYRAIYGRWPSSGQSLRMRARLELVDLYRRRGDQSRLRSALLELSSAFPGDRELQLQAGRDLLAAGFSDDAARQLRIVAQRFADAGDALTLLARAEFARGNYVDAYAAAGRAVARDRTEKEATDLRALTARVLALDPYLPGLSSRERVTRLRALLADVRERWAGCDLGTDGTANSLLPLIDQWLARRTADADLGRTLLEGAARRLPAPCLPRPEVDAVGRILADLAMEGRR